LEGTSWDDLEKAVDEVRDRFGGDVIGPARLSDTPSQ